MGWGEMGGRSGGGGGVVRRGVEESKCGAGKGVYYRDRGLGGVGVGESRAGDSRVAGREKRTVRRQGTVDEKENRVENHEGGGVSLLL